MELSTIIPTPRASPPRVIRLRVNPPKKISANVVTMEMGIDEGDHQGASNVAQEKKQHHDNGQPTPVEHRPGHIGNGPLDEIALVG